MNPLDNEDLYDVLDLAGTKSPGQCTISQAAREENWDVKEAKGKSGAKTERQGRKVARFTTTFKLTDREDYEAWPPFLALIKSTVDGPKPKALDVYHPNLAELDITSGSLAKLNNAQHDGKGGCSYAVDWIQYAPAKKAGGSPDGSTAWTKGNKKADPNAAAEAELKKLLDQAKAT